jgi:hypothetical protein
MDITLFTGCSYTEGSGFELEKNDPGLWVNLLHKNVKILQNTKLVNSGVAADSNDQIFINSVEHILKYDTKFVFVEWTSYPRHAFNLGIETYKTKVNFIPNSPIKLDNTNQQFGLNEITYTKKYLEELRDRVVTLNHPHYEIFKIVNYVNILTNLCKLKKCLIFFINGLCEWDQDFFIKKENALPYDYTNYTKKILNVDNRDDDEIYILYNKLHSEYNSVGGIQESRWLNLYNSLRKNRIDVNNDNIHPGYKSNQKYFEFLSQAFLDHLDTQSQQILD